MRRLGCKLFITSRLCCMSLMSQSVDHASKQYIVMLQEYQYKSNYYQRLYKLIRRTTGTLCRESLTKAPSHGRAEHRQNKWINTGGGVQTRNESELQNSLDTIVQRIIIVTIERTPLRYHYLEFPILLREIHV